MRRASAPSLRDNSIAARTASSVPGQRSDRANPPLRGSRCRARPVAVADMRRVNTGEETPFTCTAKAVAHTLALLTDRRCQRKADSCV